MINYELNSSPAPDSVLLGAANWLQGTLLGTVALSLATLAIAWVGFLALTGRIEMRRGATVVLGCFIIFGAPVIAGGLQSTLLEERSNGGPMVAALPEPSPPIVVTRREPPADPYAGASLIRE